MFAKPTNDLLNKMCFLMHPCNIIIAQNYQFMQGNKGAIMQVTYENHEKWLLGRKNGIGGSDASAVVGYNPYKSNVDLWEEKTNIRQPEDISNKPYIKYGHNAEPLLVELFALDYPRYKVIYNDNYRVNYHNKHDYIFCTRDCDLIDTETGQKGALEIKTTEILNSLHRERWDNQIPVNYYCQVLQYFITDEELQFVWVKAQIKSDYGNGDIRLTTKHYYFTREELQEDIEWLLNKEIEFWEKYVKTGVRPPRLLPDI